MLCGVDFLFGHVCKDDDGTVEGSLLNLDPPRVRNHRGNEQSVKNKRNCESVFNKSTVTREEVAEEPVNLGLEKTKLR